MTNPSTPAVLARTAVNPATDPERAKWYTFDLSQCPHLDEMRSTVCIQTNTSSNALDAYAMLGNCICPQCWDAMHVTIGFNEPPNVRRTKKFYEPQVSATLAGHPVKVT